MSSTMEDALRDGATNDEAGVRALFDVAVKDDGRPFARIAPETGVGYSTLLAWRGGTYQGDNAKVMRQVQAWLTSRVAQQRTKATIPDAPGFQVTKTASRIWELLEVAQTLPDMVVISGGAGVGKTFAATAYARRAPNVFIATMEPCHRTVGAALDNISQAVGLPTEYRFSVSSKQIQQRLRNARGLLVIDEAQHMSSQALDQLRSIHDLAGVGIALMGNETVFAALGANQRKPEFAQLWSRIGQRLRIRHMLKDDIDLLMNVWGLEEPDVRTAVTHIARQAGGGRVMTKVLRMASAVAGAADRDKPSAQDIQRVWSQISEATGGAA